MKEIGLSGDAYCFYLLNVHRPNHLIQDTVLLCLIKSHISEPVKLTFACKIETLGSLYSHALLILTESSKSKNQVVHGQKFKDLLSSTCQVSPERIVLDLESLCIIGIIAILVHFDKMLHYLQKPQFSHQ